MFRPLRVRFDSCALQTHIRAKKCIKPSVEKVLGTERCQWNLKFRVYCNLQKLENNYVGRNHNSNYFGHRPARRLQRRWRRSVLRHRLLWRRRAWTCNRNPADPASAWKIVSAHRLRRSPADRCTSYNLAANFGPSDCLMFSADESSATASPVFGSIRLTGDAAPCEPYCASKALLNASFAARRYLGGRFVLACNLILFKGILVLISFRPDDHNKWGPPSGKMAAPRDLMPLDPVGGMGGHTGTKPVALHLTRL